MKKTEKLTKPIQAILGIILASMLVLSTISCNDDSPSPQPDPLTAVITASATTSGPGETITISAEQSTGTDIGVSYNWNISGLNGTMTSDGQEYDLISGGTAINFGGATVAITPETTGSIFVSLQLVGDDGSASTATVTVMIAGSVMVSSFAEGFEFSDVNVDNTIPDYILEGDVSIPTSSLPEGSTIVFGIDADATIRLTGNVSGNASVIFQTESGPAWKGLVMEGGYFTGSSNITVNNAGNGDIGLVVASSVIIDTSNPFDMQFTVVGGAGYDINFTNSVQSVQSVTLLGNGGSIFGPSYLWSQLESVRASSGADLTLDSDVDVQVSGFDAVTMYGDVYFTDGYSHAGQLSIAASNSGKTVYLPSNASFIAGGGLISSALITFDGVDSGSWAGIYLGGGSSNLAGLTVRNAGSQAISSASITGLTEKASIYAVGTIGQFRDATIENSGGYGVYMASSAVLGSSTSPYRDNSFSGTTDAAVSLDQKFGSHFSDPGNSFTMGANVPAVEVRQSSLEMVYPAVEWRDLGGDNFYQFTGSLTVRTTMIIDAGAHFKFGDNRVFQYIGSSNSILTIKGTSDNPVTIEGSGNWLGMMVGSSPASTAFIDADYLIVKGGGNGTITGASEAANLIINSAIGTSPTTAQFSITNSTFSDSSGYGVVMDNSNSFSVNLEDASFGNTFSNNSSGNFLDKNLP